MIRRAAVAGSPISHSLSPALHRAAYAALGLDWEYSAIELRADQLVSFIEELDSSWVGLSLTMPLKQVVFELAESVDETARVTGSANTLLVPSREVFNTDVFGMATALTRAGFRQPAGFTATIVGAGATARSAIMAAAALGAGDVHVLARRPDAAAALRDIAQEMGIGFAAHELFDVDALDAPLVISTVPRGAADALTTHLPGRPAWLLDVVYADWPTPVAREWADRGGRTVSGLEMLLAQAERQVEIMTGLPAPTRDMRLALPSTHM